MSIPPIPAHLEHPSWCSLLHCTAAGVKNPPIGADLHRSAPRHVAALDVPDGISVDFAAVRDIFQPVGDGAVELVEMTVTFDLGRAIVCHLLELEQVQPMIDALTWVRDLSNGHHDGAS